MFGRYWIGILYLTQRKTENMTTKEIYNLAKEMTDQQVLNIVDAWKNSNENKSIETYNSLLKLGDSMKLACATVIAEKFGKKECSEMYSIAYES
jgi:hypothetical protein